MPSLRLLSEPVWKSLCNIFHSFRVDLVPGPGCQTGFMDAAIKNETRVQHFVRCLLSSIADVAYMLYEHDRQVEVKELGITLSAIKWRLCSIVRTKHGCLLCAHTDSSLTALHCGFC